MKNRLIQIKEELNQSKKNKKQKLEESNNSLKDNSIFSIKSMKNNLSKNGKIKEKETILTKIDQANTSINSTMSDKKITIKDLCPEEKARIGELLKKLAQEKEENENLRIKLENEKREYESRIETIGKENVSLLESSKVFVNQTQLNERETTVYNNSNTEDLKKTSPITEIKNLREQFSRVYENLQNSVKTQEEVFTKSKGKLEETQLINSSQTQNFLNSNSSFLREEKPLIDPFLNPPNQLREEVQSSNQLSPKLDRDLGLNFNYKKDANQNCIKEILGENNNNSNLDLFSLGSPKMSSVNIEQNYYNPSPKEIKFLKERSPKNLQSSLLNYNEEIREVNYKKPCDFKEELINNIQVQKQKQNFLLSKNKLQNVKEKISSESITNNQYFQNPSSRTDYANENNTGRIISIPKKSKQIEDNNNFQESQRKLMGSYLQCNMNRVQSDNENSYEAHKARSISQINNNMRRGDMPGKKFRSEDNSVEKETEFNDEFERSNHRVVQFKSKTENQNSRSNSKTKYQEMLCRIKEKCQNNTYNEDLNDENESENKNLVTFKNNEVRSNKFLNNSSDSDQDLKKFKQKLKSKTKLEIEKPVELLLSTNRNNFSKHDKLSIQIELNAPNLNNFANSNMNKDNTSKTVFDDDDDFMIALLNPKKDNFVFPISSGSKKTEYKVNNKSEGNEIYFDNKLVTLIDEIENTNTEKNFENLQETRIFSSNIDGENSKKLLRKYDEIETNLKEFQNQKITQEIRKNFFEEKKDLNRNSKTNNGDIQNTHQLSKNQTTFKKKTNLFEELKKLNYNYD